MITRATRKPILITMAAVVVAGIATHLSFAGGSDWLAAYDWALEVDGKVDYDARFFQERGKNRLLIMAPGLTQVALLDQTGKTIRALELDQVQVAEDNTKAQILDGAGDETPQGNYAIGRGEVVFYLGDNRLKIHRKKPLEGPIEREHILRHSPLYRKGMEEYSADPAAIASITSHTGTVDIEVYFGTWCPHCKVVIPRLMKTIAEASNPELTVSYVGVPRGFANYPAARAKGIRSIPTVIFYSGGREFARIAGEPEGTIEQDIARILGSRP